MKNVLHRCWCVLEVTIIVYVILITFFILFQNKYGYTEIGRYTFKNVGEVDINNIKNVKAGDLLIVEDDNRFNINDTIYYYEVSSESYDISMAPIVNIQKSGNSSLYTISSKNGDNVIDGTKIIGKRAIVCPFVGGFLEKVTDKIGFLLFVLLPIMIVFICQIYEFFFAVRNHRGSKNNLVSTTSKRDNRFSFLEEMDDHALVGDAVDAETEDRFKFVVEDEGDIL